MKIEHARGIVKRRLLLSISDFMHARRTGWHPSTLREYAGHMAGIASVANLLQVIDDVKFQTILKFAFPLAHSLRPRMRERAIQKASAA